MSWWMYVSVVIAMLSITTILSGWLTAKLGFRPGKLEWPSLTVVVLTTVAVNRYWSWTPVPFWLSLGVIVISFIYFGYKGQNRPQKVRTEGGRARVPGGPPICDICGSSVPESSMSEYSSFRMRAAVRSGFDPFAMQAIDTSLAKRVSARLKLDALTTYDYWKGLVREQRRPWRLCGGCSIPFAQSAKVKPTLPGRLSAREGEKARDLGLVESAANGNVPLVVGLLLRGVDPDVSDLGDSDSSPLLMAAVNGHNEVVKILIAAGARVDAEARRGVTALMLAALRGNGDVVLTLLEAGANANAQDEDGETAIMYAVKGINPVSEAHAKLQRAIITALLTFGGDSLVKNRKGETALDDVRLIVDKETKHLLESAEMFGKAEQNLVRPKPISSTTSPDPESGGLRSARSRQASPTSCAFCGNNLTVLPDYPGGTLFNGVVCKSCGAVACLSCQGSSPSNPCRECGGSVAPAFADELMKAAARLSSRSVSPSAPLPVPAPGGRGEPLFQAQKNESQRAVAGTCGSSTPSPSVTAGVVILTDEQVAVFRELADNSKSEKDVVIARSKQNWRAVLGPTASQEAIQRKVISQNDRVTVAKIQLEEKRDFKVRGVASCHQCGTAISFEAKAYFGLGGGAGDPCCPSCKAQISVSCEQPSRDSLDVFVIAKPWTVRTGASVRDMTLEIWDVTVWAREDT